MRCSTAGLGLSLFLVTSVAGAQPLDEPGEPPLPPGLEQVEEEPAQPPIQQGDQEPELPPGLEEGSEPALPPGLEEGSEPALPPGLGENEGTSTKEAPDDDDSLPWEWSGFLDVRTGVRVLDDPNQDRISLGDTRLQIHGEKNWLPMSAGLAVTADFVFDSVLNDHEPDLERGYGAIDLREAHAVASPLEWMDLKVGRQALTWGTGDLLFINDLFPKDWNAFLIGRDIEYLKAPSDALRVSAFGNYGNLDLVYTPRFDADRYPDRRRLSSWDPLTQGVVGRDAELVVEQPDTPIEDGEWAARLHRRLGRSEVAVYAYRGYWKSPAGIDMNTGAAIFPKLSVYGASVRRPLLGGIAHAEGGYYDSRQGRDGNNPMIRNSETRALVGFEREAAPNLTVGAQYYAEIMRHHGLFERSLPDGFAGADRVRHLGTLRLRYLTMEQNLELGFFGFFSPSDRDVALFPAVQYAINDEWKFSAGANVFFGKEDHTFFGQLEKNTNVYAGLRASWL